MNGLWQRRFLLRNLSTTRHNRYASAWLNRARADTDTSLSSAVDVESKFIDADVQKLLADLTGLDLENKVFKERRTSIQQRSHFALMTDERLNKTLDRMRQEGRNFLNFVPIKEPRQESVDILSKDDEICGFDNSKFVFTDITFDATDQDRTVVVREVDGTLRTATPEEHDRMNRTYYHKNNRPVMPPPVFEDPYLQDALNRNEHEFVLDWACWFYEPDDPSFIKLSQLIFDRVAETENFDVLHSTRHFGPLVFYLALNGNIPPLLNHMGGQGRVRDCANLIRLQKTLHPNWRVSIGSTDSDLKIVQDFVKENGRFRAQLKDLLAFLKDGRVKVQPREVEERVAQPDYSEFAGEASINVSNVSSESGPLGKLGKEYPVKVSKSDDGNLEEASTGDEKTPSTGSKFDRKGRGGRFNRSNRTRNDDRDGNDQ